MDRLEIAANAFTALSIVLAARNNIQTWWTGFIGCLLFCALYVRNQLYADATLQLFFIATSIVGWLQWRGAQRAVTRCGRSTLGRMAVGALIVTVAYGWTLHRFTDAYLPYVDSAVLGLSVVAQCLLMQRRVETWACWIAVDSVSVALFLSRGLALTAVLYAAFWINAWYGWRTWRTALAPTPMPQ